MNAEQQGGKCIMPSRPFGTRMDDLEADFAAARPCVITDVLARCSPGASDDEIWDLPAGERIAGLLKLAALGGMDAIDVGFTCPKCSLAVEVTLELEELLNAARSSPKGPVEIGADGNGESNGGRYRLPTGRDQLQWLPYAGESDAMLLKRMLDSLRVEGWAPPEAVEAALQQIDPLVRPVVAAICPECGHSTEQEEDVAERALLVLQAQQERLFTGVHLLASRYHWSEAEIFALPAWRREHYLNLLRGER
jgi:hypothetical protein